MLSNRNGSISSSSPVFPLAATEALTEPLSPHRVPAFHRLRGPRRFGHDVVSSLRLFPVDDVFKTILRAGWCGSDGNGVVAVEGVGRDESGTDSHYRNGIAGGYWRTMGIPLVEGRFLDDGDRERKRRVCVVDRAFAERYWPGRSALGHRLNDGPVFKRDDAFTIVGVVAPVKQSGMDESFCTSILSCLSTK